MPYFGICFGMQMACIEFARNVCGLDRANSTEVDPQTPHPVVDLMPDQRGVTDKGATMRLGSYPCVLKPGTKAQEAYGSTEINERHRHRWEVNNNYRDALERHGMVLSGLSPDGRLVEMLEIPQHPYFVACQFHPEFKSRPERAAPVVLAVREGRGRATSAPQVAWIEPAEGWRRPTQQEAGQRPLQTATGLRTLTSSDVPIPVRALSIRSNKAKVKEKSWEWR